MPLPPRAPDQKLNPELERLLYQVKVIRQEAEGLVVGMTAEQLNWSPAPGSWSVLQCLAHLNATNRKMIAALEQSVRAGRQANLTSEGPFSYGFLARLFHRMMEPPVKRKFKAPPVFVPTGSESWEKIQAEWNATHDKVDELLHQSNGLDLVRIKTTSPASSWIKYPLGIAFWIHTSHDRRHLWQARNVINDARYPKAAMPAAGQKQPV
jgi:hypothetical protein